MCADNDLQLIIVNTPTYLHYSHVKTALESGKNVLVEKPFTTRVSEAEELTALAKSKNLHLSVYQNRRYDGDYRAVKKVVDDQLLGDLREVEIRYDRYRPSFGGKQHKEGDLAGAGILYDLSPHLVDQALQLFGWPQALFADIWKMRDDVQAKDYFEILFYYEKLRVRLKATCIARQTVPAYILHGMKGSFLQERSDAQEQQLLAGDTPSQESWAAAPSHPDGLLHTELNGQVIRKNQTSSPGNYMGYFDDLYK
jgi:predicted dehydrogenase